MRLRSYATKKSKKPCRPGRGKKSRLQVVLVSVLLTLSSVITVGCGTTKPAPVPIAYRCDKPPLKGDTWADVAVLSVEQAAAIDICNIRNGTDIYSRATVANAPGEDGGKNRLEIALPPPWACEYLGVNVPHDAEVTGYIIDAYAHITRESVQAVCGENNIGCTIKRKSDGGFYDIHFSVQDPWTLDHEVCHAVYEVFGHTMEYEISRQR